MRLGVVCVLWCRVICTAALSRHDSNNKVVGVAVAQTSSRTIDARAEHDSAGFFWLARVCEWVDDAAVTGQINHSSHHRSDLQELIITRFLSLAIAHDSCCVCWWSRGVGVDNCLQPLRNLKSDIHIPSHPPISPSLMPSSSINFTF